MADHSLVIDSQARLWAWGNNREGQLGLPPSERVVTPTLTDLDDVTAIAYSTDHSLAIRGAGDVWAWGAGGQGRLGLGDTLNREVPEQIRSLEEIVAIACGTYHSLALDNQGQVWGWGGNTAGQLAGALGDEEEFEDEELEMALEPVPIQELPPAVAIACGDYHSLIIDDRGYAWGWGANHDGNLGIGIVDDVGENEVRRPTQIVEVVNIVAIAAGETNSLFLDNQGQVWASGQVLYDPNDINYELVLVPDLIDIVAISVGLYHALALDESGQLWSWGYNPNGQLGFGAEQELHRPKVVKTNIKDMICLNNHSLAIDYDNRVWAWGQNYHGQLGLGNVEDQYRPTLITSLPKNAGPYSLHKYSRGQNIKATTSNS